MKLLNSEIATSDTLNKKENVGYTTKIIVLKPQITKDEIEGLVEKKRKEKKLTTSNIS